MAAEQIKSLSVTNNDAQPWLQNTAGQGAAGRTVITDDFVSCAATPLASTKSIYRIIRFPAQAIIKSLTIATDKALDSGTPTLAFDFNVAWADSSNVAYCPLAFQLGTLGLAATEAVIPTTANDGATTTTVSAYSSPNKMFGTVTPSSNAVAYGPTAIEFNGLQSGGYNLKNLTAQPLYQVLGFVDGRGNPADPGGYFDLLAYVSTAANVGVAGTLYARLTYAI